MLASFAEKRTTTLPDIPTMLEVGFKDATSSPWYSRCDPAKTPAATIAALNKALNGALANAEVKEKLTRTGTEPTTSTPWTGEVPSRRNREMATSDRGFRI